MWRPDPFFTRYRWSYIVRVSDIVREKSFGTI